MATLSACAQYPPILVMNYVQPQSDYTRILSGNAEIASTIAARNGKLSTFTSGDLYSSSNYVKIKRLALSGTVITQDGTCASGVNSLLAASLPSSNYNSELVNQINNILARG